MKNTGCGPSPIYTNELTKRECILTNNILNKEMNKGIFLKMRASIYIILNDRLIVRISNTGHMSLSFQNVNNFRIVYRIIIFKFKKCMVINLFFNSKNVICVHMCTLQTPTQTVLLC